MFRDLAKTRKIARRVGESIKLEGWGDHKWRQSQNKCTSKIQPKPEAEKHPKMVPKWIQKAIKHLMDFWVAPGMALGRQKGATTDSYPPVLGPRGRVGKG